MKAPRKQCAKCPWKVTTDPHDIPNGYCPTKHAKLDRTIARSTSSPFGTLHVMPCHHSSVGQELPCVGWLVNQLGPGNNIGLRLRAISGAIDANVRTVGPQHERFEDTLPKLTKKGHGK